MKYHTLCQNCGADLPMTSAICRKCNTDNWIPPSKEDDDD